MYVPKNPKRWDFCGCPPCGLCYDWAEPAPPVVVEEGSIIKDEGFLENQGYRIDGVRKMVEDIVGPDSTEEQRRQVYEGAVLVHEKNLLNAKKDPLDLHQETIDEGFTRRGVESFLRQKAVEAAVVKPKVNYVTCDSIADKEAVKGKTIEEKIEIEEKTKNNVKVPTFEYASVDEGLLKRERKFTGEPSREDRNAMIQRYKEEMARKKARWEAIVR